MKHFKATTTSNHEFATKTESHTFEAVNMMDARHWVINHCDCSRSWNVEEIGELVFTTANDMDNPVSMFVNDDGQYVIQCGDNITVQDDDYEAGDHLGNCIMYALTREGKLDNAAIVSY